MTESNSSLYLYLQDDKLLSCKRWFVLFAVYSLNICILVLSLISMGLFGATESNKSNAMEGVANLKIRAQKEIELNKKAQAISWYEAKSVKYAKYKINYLKEGMVHVKGMVANNNNTVRVNIIEINKNINSNLIVKPQIASERLNSRVKIKTIAEKTNSIAAINGGYFKPQTGVPLGALVIDNELLTGPIYNRVAISINKDGTYSIGKTDFEFFIKNKKINLKIDNINQPRMLSTYTLLYTDRWGKISPPPPKYGANIIVENGIAKGIYNSSVEIPKNGFVISAPKSKIQNLVGEKKLKLNIKYPKHFKDSEHIISGGPYLIKDGEIYINTKEEKLTAITGKNPRTLIGYTKNNDLILVTIDGREAHSIGMSLYESARFMQKLGCINAINLDGGSSSVMYVDGQITNQPPTKDGIPLSGVITIFENSTIASK